MAGGFILNAAILEELENAERRHELRINQRVLRDASNPFNIPNAHFLKYYRLSKTSAMYLIDQLSPFMRDSQRTTAIPKTLKIFAALNFFGQGSYQFGIGQTYLLGMSQPSVSRCISEVSEVIVNNLLNEWIKFPTTVEMKNEIKQGFRQKYNISGVIGLIDCSHIAIIAPPAEDPNYPGRVYYNRKGYTSINTQIICDFNRTILNINARFPGSTHDSAIWMTSNIRRHLEQNYLNGDNFSFLFGDSGYPLQPWLLTPVDHAAPGTREELYNALYTRARSVIECVNGILKGRFRCLLRHRTLNYDPIKSANIIYSCALLHNISIAFNDELPDDENIDLEDNDNGINNGNGQMPNPPIIDGNWHAQGQRIRNNLIQLLN